MISNDDTDTVMSDLPAGFNIKKRRRSQEKRVSSPQKDKIIKAISNHLLNNFEKNF